MVGPLLRALVLSLTLAACGGELDAAPRGAGAGGEAASISAGAGAAGEAGAAGSTAVSGGGGGTGGALGAGSGGAVSAGQGGASGAAGQGGKPGTGGWMCAPTPGAGKCAMCASIQCCPEILACYADEACVLADVAYDQCQLNGEDPCLPLLEAGGPLGEALRACKAENCPKCN